MPEFFAQFFAPLNSTEAWFLFATSAVVFLAGTFNSVYRAAEKYGFSMFMFPASAPFVIIGAVISFGFAVIGSWAFFFLGKLSYTLISLLFIFVSWDTIKQIKNSKFESPTKY
jgi:hypothetical protein